MDVVLCAKLADLSVHLRMKGRRTEYCRLAVAMRVPDEQLRNCVFEIGSNVLYGREVPVMREAQLASAVARDIAFTYPLVNTFRRDVFPQAPSPLH